MDHGLEGIDHVIVGVNDLEAARATYGRLGFTCTPRGRHVGWGTANYCVMFERDYLELLGIVDPTQFTNGLDRLLESGEGMLGAVFGTRDPEATYEFWKANGLEPAEPQALGRLLEGDAPADLKFRNVLLDRSKTAGLGFFACQHLTPEPLRRPQWLQHPNGAVAIRSCTIVANEAAPVSAVLAQMLGTAAVSSTDKVHAAHARNGSILVAPPEDAGLLHPWARIPESVDAPRFAVLTIAVEDRQRTASCLDAEHVTFGRSVNGDIMVPPDQANGVAIEFVADR
ncbi:MAG: VOC family protein [Geminicoccaceae bacterium]